MSRTANSLICLGLRGLGLICWMVAVAGTLESRADIPNPRIRDVTPEVAFPGVEQHADHVFLIHLEERSGPVHMRRSTQRVIPITGPDAFPLRASNVVRMSILAIPRNQFDSLSNQERQALSPTTAGVLSSPVKPPRTEVDVNAPNPPLKKYRVSLDMERLTVEELRDQIPAARAPVRSDMMTPFAPATGRFGFLWYVGVVACLIWSGLVFSRRLLRDRQDAPPEPPDGGRSDSDKT
jgi:hypothetical protein